MFWAHWHVVHAHSQESCCGGHCVGAMVVGPHRGAVLVHSRTSWSAAGAPVPLLVLALAGGGCAGALADRLV